MTNIRFFWISDTYIYIYQISQDHTSNLLPRVPQGALVTAEPAAVAPRGAAPHRSAPLRTSPWSNGASAHLASMSTTPPLKGLKGTETHIKHEFKHESNMNQTHETIRKYSHPNSKKHNMQMLPCRLSLNLLSLNMSKKPSSWVCIYIYSNLPKIKRRFNLTLSLVRILNLFCPFGHYYTIGDISWYKHVSTTLNKMEATKLFYIIFLTVSEKHMKVSRITSSLKLQIHIIWITFINLHHNIQFNHWFLHLH